jgi:hypothetical protein
MSGQYSNNQNKGGKGISHPTVYTPYVWVNGQSNVDKTKLSPSFSMGMLKLAILPKIVDNTVEYDKFAKDEKEAGVAIYLTHTKALLLLKDAKEFIDNPSMASSVGVDSGTGENQGIIQFSNGVEFGTNNICLVIRRLTVDESGKPAITSSFAYEFKTESHYTIRNFDANTLDFDRVYHEGLEIEQFFILLDQYIKAQTNAVAHTIREQLNYQDNRINTKLDMLHEHFGLEAPKNNNRGGGNNNNKPSIFGDKNSGRNFNTSSLDDIDNM